MSTPDVVPVTPIPASTSDVTSAIDGADGELGGERVFRRSDILPLVCYVAFGMALGWQLGQDANWDVRNYHLYNPFMLLSGRFERDIHVAGVQTFLNPLLHLPFYFAIIFEVPPIWYGLALSGVHGVLLFFVHRITTLILAAQGSLVATTGGALAAITSAYGAAFYAEIGSTLGDSTVGLLVLGALALLMANVSASQGRMLRASRVVGLALGLAAGAKLVACVYAFGMLGAMLIVPGTWRERLHRSMHFGVTATLGLALTGGYWMWLMYQHFGSPLFPFYNALFASPLAPLQNFSEAYHPPGTWEVAFEFPFYFLEDQLLASETYFRDGRLPAALVALVTIGLVATKRRLSGRGTTTSVDGVRLGQLAAFFALTYVVWLAAFALYRYALSLEALSAVLIVACGVYLARNRSEGLLLAVPICAMLILSTKSLEYGRIPWTDSFFGVASNRLTQYRDAVVLLTDFPSAYTVPFFPQSTTFLRISSNWGLDPGNQMWQRLQERVAAAPSKRLYWMEISPYATQAEADSLLAPFGLTLPHSPCDETMTNFDSVRICQVERR